jgi:hypothetical protein
LHHLGLGCVHALPLLHLQDLRVHGLLHAHETPPLGAPSARHGTRRPRIMFPAQKQTNKYIVSVSPACVSVSGLQRWLQSACLQGIPSWLSWRCVRLRVLRH